MFNIIQIILWFIFSLLILSKTTNKKIKIFFAMAFTLIGTLEAVSVYLTDNLIDYRFYSHLKLESIQEFGPQFIMPIIVGIIFYLIMTILLYYISMKLKVLRQLNKTTFITAVVVLVFILSLSNGVLGELSKIYKIINADKKSFQKALEDVNINPKQYILPESVKASKGKNIIVISIESLEQGFLGPHFNNITPHLSRLAQEWTYYPKMPSIPGTNWTAGSLYAHQVGVPAFFKSQGFFRGKGKMSNGYIHEEGQGNDLFQNLSNTKLVGVGTVLKKAGYESRYMMGGIEFAGAKDLLQTYGFKTVSEKNSIGKYEQKSYGMDDYDLFSEAKLQIEDMLKDKDKPFALFMSTINSHFPNGVYDKRMEQHISKQSNNLEFTVSSVDYLINDLLNFLKEKHLLENTAIYIFPDHLLMGRGGPVHEKLNKEERQLYLLTNASENKFHKKTIENIYQIDLPKMILDGANIKTNAKFLVDFVKSTNITNFLTQNRVQLTTLNQASVTREQFKEQINISLNKNILTINSGTQKIKLKVDTNYEVIDLTFSPDMVLVKQEKLSRRSILRAYGDDIKNKYLHLVIIVDTQQIDSAYLGNKQKVGIFKKGPDVKFLAKEIESIETSNYIINQSKREFIVKLDRNVEKSEQIFSIKNEKIKYHKLSEFTLEDKNGTVVLLSKHNDPIMVLNKVRTSDKHTVLSCKIESDKEGVFQLFYKRNKTINYNGKDSYIVKLCEGINTFQLLIPAKYINNDLRVDIVDQIGKYKIHDFSIYGVKKIKDKKIKKSKQDNIDNNIKANIYAKDVDRFIAHAGGEIDGYKYTNSLESLELFYEKGFRLFELDIIKTSDNHYVAAHDWKHWAKITNFTGTLPPDLETFKKQKIYNKYHLMSMNDINLWFKEHSDAILVTDKINSPLDFSKKFIDKQRLMMELFTWDAVKEGIEIGIKSPMPTGTLLKKIPTCNKVDFLKKLGVKDIAASRNFRNTQKDLLLNIAKEGIHVYHFDVRTDERHIVCHDRNYYYGLYADNWSFNTHVDCSKIPYKY